MISYLRLAKFFVPLSAVLTLLSIALLVWPGPKLSIDFTGGTLMELSLPDGKTKGDIAEAVKTFTGVPPLGNVALSATKGNTVLLRMRDMSNEEHLALLKHIAASAGTVRELQFTVIGPTVGASLKKGAVWALIIASTAIIVYIAFAFRKVPRRLSPWRFGIIAVITLLHDLLITTGIFVVIGQFSSFEVDTLFITALLTVLGYSVNDTIIVFDRIRENVSDQGRKEDFSETADRSLRQSISRSINTSGSTLIMLLALAALGAESIRWFVLTLSVGIILGTYSSIFLATPLLVYWKKKE